MAFNMPIILVVVAGYHSSNSSRNGKEQAHP